MNNQSIKSFNFSYFLSIMKNQNNDFAVHFKRFRMQKTKLFFKIISMKSSFALRVYSIFPNLFFYNATKRRLFAKTNHDGQNKILDNYQTEITH